MSEQREFNASTVEEALDTAASKLGTNRDDLSYRTLDEGSSGFLGLGARDARIMVELPANDENPPVDEETRTPQIFTETPQSEPVEEELPSSIEEDTTPTAGSGEESEELSEEFLSEIRDHVEATLDAMSFDNEVSVRVNGEVVSVNIESEDAGLLIGQKGETIDAVQYLVNVAIYRNRTFSKKIVLDCGGYRDRRVNAVQGMAHRAAKRAVRDGKAVDLPPMSSSERRAVHSYLKDDPRVTTSSDGNEENRRVTISPA